MLDLRGRLIDDFFGMPLSQAEFDQLRDSRLWEDQPAYAGVQEKGKAWR